MIVEHRATEHTRVVQQPYPDRSLAGVQESVPASFVALAHGKDSRLLPFHEINCEPFRVRIGHCEEEKRIQRKLNNNQQQSERLATPVAAVFKNYM